MPIQGDVKNLYSDREKTRALFPTTKVSAVSDDNGVGLDALMENLLYSGIEVPEASSVPLNADTLEGHPASDFATPSFVTSEIAKAQLSGGSGGDIDLSGFATKDDVNNAVRAIDYPVDSVNGKTGAVQLSASDVGAAPSGYGLGLTSGAYVDDCNMATAFGLYSVSYATENNPLNAYGSLLVLSHNDTEKCQILNSSYNKSILIRYETGGVWGEWEWVNPPMQLGTEYRTTERWNGKVVYTKMIHYGKGPSNGAANLHSAYPENAVFTEVSCKAVNSDGWGSFLNQYLSFGENGAATRSIISLSGAGDLSQSDLYLTAKYYLV